MQTPMITKETLDWLEVICDIPPKASDSNELIRWKAAQRNIFVQAKGFYDLQNKSKGDRAEKLGFNIRSDS